MAEHGGELGNVPIMRTVEALGAQVLKGGARLRIKARGGSMLPFFRDGDVTLVRPAAATEIGIGDVICYETLAGQLVLHRVIGRNGERFVTKGDALAFREVVDPSQLLGKVIAMERHGTIRRLDTRVARWCGLAIVALSPVIPSLLLIAFRVRGAVRGRG